MITIGTESLSRKKYRVDATRHLSVIGGSGHGKSSLLERVFVSFVSQPKSGGAFFDPHGDSARVLPLLIPKERRDDIIYIDPDMDANPQFNPLYFKDSELLEQAIETCITVLKSLSGSESAWGNLTPYNVRNGLDNITEFEKEPILVHLMKWLADKKYRSRLLRKSKQPFVKLYADIDLEQDAYTAAINKVAKLLRPNILSLIGWPESLDLLDSMNSGKIFIFRLSKGALGEETAQILYSLILSLFSIAALKREQQEVRPPFLLVCDEAQNAEHGGRLNVLLAEARKYGISTCTAFQQFHQVTFMHDILANAGTQIVFNSSGEDARVMADNWNDEQVMPTHITGLARYKFYVRKFNDDNNPEVKLVEALPALKPNFKSREEREKTLQGIIYQSERRYGVPRKDIEAKVKEILT